MYYWKDATCIWYSSPCEISSSSELQFVNDKHVGHVEFYVHVGHRYCVPDTMHLDYKQPLNNEVKSLIWRLERVTHVFEVEESRLDSIYKDKLEYHYGSPKYQPGEVKATQPDDGKWPPNFSIPVRVCKGKLHFT